MRLNLDIDPTQLVESAPVPWCVMAAGVLVAANPLFAEVAGAAAPADLLGVSLVNLLHPSEAAPVRRRIAAGGRWRAAARLRATSTDGLERHARLSAADVVSAEDQGLVLLVMDDVTELHQALEELRELRDQAVTLAERRREFVGTVTHELRSPLHAILGLGELALSAEGTEEQRSLLTRMIGEASRMRQTVDELLALARSDADEVPVDVRTIDVSDLLERVRERVRRSDRTRADAILVTIDPRVPARISTDEYRLDRILTNLVANAATYADGGTVRVDVVPHGHEQLRLVVADDGPGVPEEFREQIFEPFVRVPGGLPGGTGLGLPLVRSLVRTLSGSIELRCPEEGGSVFTVTLPALADATATREPRASTPTPTSSASARVLVVEDTEMIQMLATRQLEGLGHVPTIAATGAAALAAVAAAEPPFDLVLMDWRLSDMIGSEVAQEIRAWERREGRTRLPIVAITANAMPDTRAACLAAGMDDFLAKPVSLDALRRAISRLHQPSARPGESAAAPLIDLAALLQLAPDPTSPEPVLDAARVHLRRAAHDLDALDPDDPPGLRALLLPHTRVASALGLVRLTGAFESLLADRDAATVALLESARRTLTDTRDALSALADEEMS